jgi:hypothetical protein
MVMAHHKYLFLGIVCRDWVRSLEAAGPAGHPPKIFLFSHQDFSAAGPLLYGYLGLRTELEDV